MGSARHPQYTRAHYGQEAVGGSLALQHTMSPRKRNTITAFFSSFLFSCFSFFSCFFFFLFFSFFFYLFFLFPFFLFFHFFHFFLFFLSRNPHKMHPLSLLDQMQSLFTYVFSRVHMITLPTRPRWLKFIERPKHTSITTNIPTWQRSVQSRNVICRRCL